MSTWLDGTKTARWVIGEDTVTNYRRPCLDSTPEQLVVGYEIRWLSIGLRPHSIKYFLWGPGDEGVLDIESKLGISSSHYARPTYQDVHQSSEGRFKYTSAIEVQHRMILLPSIHGITRFSLGSNHALALAAKGTILAWTYNERYQIA